MSMLTLTDPRWNTWQDAYGSAATIPHLLEQVITNKSQKHDLQSGPWFELWSRLYHQGTIYSASYAAVIVISDAIKNVESSIAMDFFLLPASIELSRNDNNISPPIPPDLEADYYAAIKELGASAGHFVNEANDPYLQKSATAAQLISNGKIDEARELIDA
jgi:hypothetical protein